MQIPCDDEIVHLTQVCCLYYLGLGLFVLGFIDLVKIMSSLKPFKTDKKPFFWLIVPSPTVELYFS